MSYPRWLLPLLCHSDRDHVHFPTCPVTRCLTRKDSSREGKPGMQITLSKVSIHHELAPWSHGSTPGIVYQKFSYILWYCDLCKDRKLREALRQACDHPPVPVVPAGTETMSVVHNLSLPLKACFAITSAVLFSESIDGLCLLAIASNIFGLCSEKSSRIEENPITRVFPRTLKEFERDMQVVQ